MERKWIIAVLIVVLVGGLTADAEEPDSLMATIDSLVTAAMNDGPRAGLSVAVMQKGEMLFAKGYGYANVELEAPATEHTVYHVGSITKHLTALAILKLAEEGKLHLDDRITKFLPDYPTQGNIVLIADLLSQTSGMESYTSIGEEFERRARLDLPPDSVLALVKDRPFHFAPRDEWRYCNTGWYLLGLIIEKVSGQTYADFMREDVFRPLGMGDTQYGYDEPLIRNRAEGYVRKDGTLVNAEIMSWQVPFAAGGMCSTVLDLVKLESALNEHRLLNEESLMKMRAPTSLSDGTVIDYGFGTRLGSLDGHRVLGHTGSGGGFQSVLAHYPDDDLTIVILSNTEADVLRTEASIARWILHAQPAAVKEVKLSKEELSQFPGTWESDEGKWELFAVDGKMRVRPAGSQAPGDTMSYLGGGVFRIRDMEDVRFLTTGGKMDRGEYYVGGLLMDVVYRERK